MRFLTVFLSLILLNISSSLAQSYEIKVHVKNLTDSTVQLAYYYANNQYIAASTTLDNKGNCVIKGKEPLPQGLYVFVLPGTYFDMIINEQQKFSIEIDAKDPLASVKFKNSDENTQFLNYQRTVSKSMQTQTVWQQMLADQSLSEDSLKIVQNKIEQLNKEMSEYWQKVANDNKGLFLSDLLHAMNGDPGKYFKNINFNDARLLYSPVLYKSLQSLLARNVNNIMPAPIIIADIDSFMIRAKTNKEIYKYSLNYLLDFLLSYQKAGLNLVFQHLAYTYALTDSVDWLDEKAKAMIKKTADEWTSASVGNQAPELNMATINGDSIDLYSLNTHFTLLLFWKTGCGHCLNTVKALKVFYDQTDSLDISIFAVFTKTDKADWQAFLDEEGIQNLWYNVWDEKETTNYHSKYYVISTPLLYVLDQNKIIVSIWNGDEEIKKLIDNLQSQRSKLQKIK